MRYRKPRKTIAAAVSIDPALYQQVMTEKVANKDNNFSRYVRDLIRRDLDNPEVLEERLAEMGGTK